LSENQQALAEAITTNMGKPITQAQMEVKRCIEICQWNSEHIERLLTGTYDTMGDGKCGWRLKGTGIIHKIAPFNFPLVLIFKNLVPNVLVGNVSLIRPAQTCPDVGLLLQELSKKYDIGGFEIVYSNPSDLDYILSDERVTGVSFTGSTAAGRAIGEIAGRNLKKSVLELGGMDPYVVLEDADIVESATNAVTARLNNAGQVCNAPKRFIVPEAKVDEFITNLQKGIKGAKIGDPILPSTTLGPLSSDSIMKSVSDLVTESVNYGDSLVYGGDKIGHGHYNPAIIRLKDTKSPLWTKEVFGPVFSITTYKNEDEALELANDSEYGLGAIVFGTNKKHSEDFASKINAGMIYVNSPNRGLHTLPFGGVKNSGYGREGGEDGVHSFANVQTYFSKN